MAEPREKPSSDPKADSRLDSALEDTFPASDPVSFEHSDHAGAPPGHKTPDRPADVVDNPSQNRFELALEASVAVAYYRRDGNRLTLLHTEVPQELSGRGIGTRLADGVFQILRAEGVRVVAKCPFMAAYASRHPELTGMLDG
jgi:uncharacterized protein